jgi:hypothetical protein
MHGAIVIVVGVIVHVPGRVMAVVDVKMPGEPVMIVQRAANDDGGLRQRTSRGSDLRDGNQRSLGDKCQGRRQHNRAGDPPQVPVQGPKHQMYLSDTRMPHKAAILAWKTSANE